LEALELRRWRRSFTIRLAGVAELADALDSKAGAMLGSNRLIDAALTFFQSSGPLHRIALESFLIAGL